MNTKNIIDLIETRMATSELWAEAFAQLDAMEDIGQNSIVWWMRTDIEESKQWDENLASIADKLELMGEEAIQRARERQERKALRRRSHAAPVSQQMTRLDEALLERYHRLPRHERLQFRSANRLLRGNPSHRSLDFKPVRPESSIYTARVDRTYRMLGRKDGDEVIWFWIGSDYDCERLIS
jgi:hypothetical protein